MKKYKQIDWSLVTIPIIVVFGLSFLLEHFPKNSQLILEGIRSFLNNQLSFLYILVGLFFFISTPVSYTHLDVYKRQGNDYMEIPPKSKQVNHNLQAWLR